MCPRPQCTDLTYGRYQILWTDIPFSIPTSAWIIQDCVQNFKSIALFGHYRVYHRRTDRHISNVLEFCIDQMSPRNLWSQIIISRRYTRIDKTNILYEEGIKIGHKLHILESTRGPNWPISGLSKFSRPISKIY